MFDHIQTSASDWADDVLALETIPPTSPSSTTSLSTTPPGGRTVENTVPSVLSPWAVYPRTRPATEKRLLHLKSCAAQACGGRSARHSASFVLLLWLVFRVTPRVLWNVSRSLLCARNVTRLATCLTAVYPRFSATTPFHLASSVWVTWLSAPSPWPASLTVKVAVFLSTTRYRVKTGTVFVGQQVAVFQVGILAEWEWNTIIQKDSTEHKEVFLPLFSFTRLIKLFSVCVWCTLWLTFIRRVCNDNNNNNDNKNNSNGNNIYII